MQYSSYANTEAASDEELYKKAKKIVRHKLAFYSNLITYVIVISFLWVMNLYSTPGHLWAIWPTLGWGLGVVVQGLHLFLYSDLQLRREQMIREEMSKMGKS